MKIIDEKGKLFGKINTLDLIAVIIVIIIIILSISWGINYFNTSKGKLSTLYIEMQVCEGNSHNLYNCGNLPTYYSDMIKKEEFILKENIKNEIMIIGKIIDKYETKKIDTRRDIKLILELNVSEKDGFFLFNNKNIRLKEPIDIDIKKTTISGVVIEFDKNLTSLEYIKLEKTATIKIYNQPKWIADKIKANDKEVDDKGRVIAEILSKKVQNAQRELETEDGSLVLAKSPINKDIILEVLLIAEKEQDELFFHGDSLKIGKWIYLSLDEIDISGNVIDIE